MSKRPYHVFIEGQFFDNLRRTQEAISKLRQKLRTSHPDRVLVIVTMYEGGGARMHARRFAEGHGIPEIHITQADRDYDPAKVTIEQDYRRAVERMLAWYPIDAAILFPAPAEPGDEERAIRMHTKVAAELLAEAFIKTYVVEK